MKKTTHGLGLLLLAIAGAASAQTATNGVRQQRAVSPAQRAATPVTPATTIARPAITAVNTQPALAGKMAIPANLMSVEDRAIIIVGGKPVAAGDLKRQLHAELRQQSVPGSAKLTRTPARVAPVGVPLRDDPRIRPKIGATDRIEATQHAPGISGAHGGGRDTLHARPAMSYMDAVNYCKTHSAEISGVRGTVTPNGRFKIEGMCFGDQTGAVEAIGQFPGGNMRLVFERWTDGEITAFVPPVSGAVDHAIALTVVRLDKRRSPAAQAYFIATRQQVPVPPRSWNPGADFLRIEVDQGGGNIFSGYTVWGAGADSRVTPFTLFINPACALDSAAWNSSTGHVTAFNGWHDPGPPNQANLEVVWTPRCVTQTTNYIVASSSQRICSIDFQLSAWASCPVGVAP